MCCEWVYYERVVPVEKGPYTGMPSNPQLLKGGCVMRGCVL